ncbi:phage holin family protein [Facklamia lactis]|uniref:phage holin family protein n=1 Tax=Facklamia lactis TaxID=2749967 RepID=UPI0018CC9F75|nr:phage holin family protein [Facklamia lactis]MBG9980435.1 phage holin family protein [Facklamia lactis]
MKVFIKYFDAFMASIGILLGWYLGSADGFLYALLAFVIVDYLTGVLRAGVERKLSSTIGFKGIAKKIMIFIMVGIAHLVDAYLLTEANGLTRTAVIFFYISNEGLSIIENSGAIGLPIPKKLRTALKQLNNDESSDSKSKS